ncbi:MAG: signal peptidase I [Candidatus Omnitrophota bacterium]
MTNTKKSVIRDWVESIIIAFILAMVVRTFIVQAFKIPTGSMRMTLIEGDHILVNKFIYGARIPLTDIRLPKVREPKRGDVIVFLEPEEQKKYFIKRLIGLPGETIEIKDGNIYINGKIIDNNLINNRYYYNKGDFGEAGKKITIPSNSYFVLGDNSNSSRDSRYWGFLPKKNLTGQAMLIYWPITRIRIVK